MREGEPDPADEQALRARVRELVADGRLVDALDVVLDRVAALERRGEPVAVAGADPWLAAPEIAPIEVAASPRSWLARLPRVSVEDGGDARCRRCGAPGSVPSTRRRLELSAGRLRVEVQRVLACGACDGSLDARADGLLPGAGMLAHVVVAAQGDGVPYARQALAMRRGGASIAAPVLEAWTAAVADALAPIAREIDERARTAAVVVARRSAGATVLVGDELWCSVTAGGEPLAGDHRVPVIDRAARAVALLRAGSSLDARATTIATVLGTCELASVAPVAHLASVLGALDAGVRASRTAELLPKRL